MQNIINHKHTFHINGNKIVVNINYREGRGWSCDIVEGRTGTGSMRGGGYASLDEYIKHIESQHGYSYAFFKY